MARVVVALLLVLGAGALLLGVVTVLPNPAAPEVESPWIGPFLWESRGLDLAVQALLILAGVLGVLLLLGREGEGGP